MAIITVGAPLSGIRGTVGGITYSANKSGPYAKQWAPSTTPNTPTQTIEQGFLGSMPQLWRALTPVQQAAWDTFAALAAQELTNSLGQAYYISGFGWFCKCNVRLLRVGRATIVPVPTQARPAAPTIDDFRVCVAGTESDLCTCGVATSSSDDGVHDASKAFDNNLSSTWITAFGVTAAWIRYDLCDVANVKHYRIHPIATALNASPADWTFEVFSGAAWQVIHTVTGEAGWADQWYDFYCPNPYTETDYRIDVTANQGHANSLMIAEIEFMAGDEGSSVIIYPEDEFANAPDYDLILHIAMANSTGRQVQYPGFYQILAMQDPTRWHEVFQTELEAKFGTISLNRAWFAQLYRQTQEGLRSSAATERTETIS